MSSKKTILQLPSIDATYGNQYGRYVANIQAASQTTPSHTSIQFLQVAEVILADMKKMYKRGVGTNFYNNPVRYLDQINKQGSPVDYFTHPNTANHLWGNIANIVGDAEVIKMDYMNFVDPTVSIVENWKQQVKEVTGIQPAKMEFLARTTKTNLYARATYRASGHLMKFEICLPGPVWHDVTFNHALFAGLPVYSEIFTKAMVNYFDAFKQPMDGAINHLVVDQHSNEAKQATQQFFKEIDQTFTLYGMVSSPITNTLFMYLARKYSSTVKFLMNPITSGISVLACMAMEEFDPVKDKQFFEKSRPVFGSAFDEGTKLMSFVCLDSPDMPSLLMNDFNERIDFLNALPQMGFMSGSRLVSMQKCTSFSKLNINGDQTFISPSSLLFGPVIDKSCHFKIIDTSIDIVSVIVDSFATIRNSYRDSEQQIPSFKGTKLDPLSADYVGGDWGYFPDSYRQQSGDPVVSGSSYFTMIHLTKTVHENPEFVKDGLWFSSGPLYEDVVRHYPLKNTKVKIKLGVTPYGNELNEVYRAAYNTPIDYDSHSYIVEPSEDGRYLHGAITGKTQCVCGKSFDEHKDVFCAFSEGLFDYNDGSSDFKVMLWKAIRAKIDSGYVFSNGVELNLFRSKTAWEYLQANRQAFTSTKEGADKAMAIFMPAERSMYTVVRAYGNIESLIPYCTNLDAPVDETASKEIQYSFRKMTRTSVLLAMSQEQLLEEIKLDKNSYLNGSIVINANRPALLIYILRYTQGVRLSQFLTKDGSLTEQTMRDVLNDFFDKVSIMEFMEEYRSDNPNSTYDYDTLKLEAVKAAYEAMDIYALKAPLI